MAQNESGVFRVIRAAVKVRRTSVRVRRFAAAASSRTDKAFAASDGLRDRSDMLDLYVVCKDLTCSQKDR